MAEGTRSLVCGECGEPFTQTQAMQRFHRSCSELRDRRRKAEWAAAHGRPSPRSQEARRQTYDKKRSRIQEAGVLRSDQASLLWDEEGPDLIWLVRVAVPFTYAYSKNATWRNNGKGHVYLRNEAKAAREALTWEIKSALKGRRVAHNRLWLDIFVDKPDHRGDAINVQSTVADAVQDATGLDDRWYSVRRIDWAVTKKEPRLMVGIGQDSEEDVCVCSHCGQVLPLSAFGKGTSKLGVNRACKECQAAARLRKKMSAPK